MQEHSFATLITQHEGAPFATHLPFLLQTNSGPYGTLVGHMARANPQWRGFSEERKALVIFQGPHAYISPSWYAEKVSVPTWNYAAVHAYGSPRLLDDGDALYELLHTTVRTYEAQFSQPWTIPTPDDYVRQWMKGVVSFELPITRLEGKLKLSQNLPVAEQRRVIAGLEETGDPMGAAVAKCMRERQ